MKNPIKLLTRKIRADLALRYLSPEDIHIDIGCGQEKYLLKRSPCNIKIGYDEKLGSKVNDTLPEKTGTADYITMLAVIEHLDNPRGIIKECYRILKNDGTLIMATPKKTADLFIKLYTFGIQNITEEHKQYFDLESMEELLNGYFIVNEYKTFELGLNQLFVCKKGEDIR